MSAEEVLRSNEKSVISGENQIVSRVVGKDFAKKRGKKIGALTAGGFITLILGVILVFFLTGNLVPVAFSERLIEETDVQYADAVESKLLVFQQALYSHDIPENTITRLKNSGVDLAEGENGEYALLFRGQVINAKDFVAAVKSNAELYDAFNNATYSRAAYWYDDAARKIIRNLGTERNNYSDDSDFDEVMSKLTGEGSNVSVNNVTLTTRTTEDGSEEVYEAIGDNIKSSEAAEFVTGVTSKNVAGSATEATLNAADTLNKSDIMAKEQKSSIFFLAFMENISKMKAGEGNDSKINEAMNYLYEPEVSTVVDTTTGEVRTVEGSMVESPSLYAILSGEKVDKAAVSDYASDRVLRTVENQLGTTAPSETLGGTVTSTSSRIRGTVGRYVSGNEAASQDTLKTVIPTINGSMVENGFSNIKGVAAGELLVEGAVNVGKALARASGATTGDATAAINYARATETILALDAEVDRKNRSPFDITSRNTFLGSIVYKLAVLSSKNTGIMGMLKSLAKVAMSGFIGVASADDQEDGYLTSFGNCETLGNIGAVGTAGCSSVMTFDTTTLNNPFGDSNFIKFVEENTTLENGVRRIKNDSTLADFIKYNNERKTPDGVTDGGILSAIKDGSSIPFVSDIISMIELYLGTSDADKRIASGAAYVNSANNPDWEQYKYAQRYVSLARAAEALRMYDGDPTAYNNMKFFEGEENPVVAFLNDYYKIASK
ncbi:hypothetical protein IJ118_01570 [Candidatus Saccharibacteria bacterium]|nr:hypothetical protein [Candidatus Saccharibacteria bacterium]